LIPRRRASQRLDGDSGQPKRAADHDELVTPRAEEAMLHREKPAGGDQLVHAQKLNVGLEASLGKAGCRMGRPVVPLSDGRYTASLPLAVGG
jgi:hypothetical protein